ncbi:MAG: EAL domain-containing protein [Rhodospirillales bacterium]|nr:MAG: EAL domain-containing protein [Rhodospirillales bacterium]
MKQGLPKEIMTLPHVRRMLSAVVETAPVALCVINRNLALSRVEGQEFPELGLHLGGGRPASCRKVWQDQPALVDAARRALKGETVSTTVVAGENAYDLQFLPVIGRGGKPQSVIAVFADVTSRYTSLVQIPDREEFLQGIIDTVVDGIVTIDQLGLIRDFNPSAALIFGYQPSEVVGKTLTMLMPEPYRSEHHGYVERYLATGKSTVIGKRRELAGLRKDGTIFPIEIAISELEVGDQRHFTGVIRDITERKEAERALRASEERYALAARGANDGLWDWNLEDNTIYFSPRFKAMLGYREDEIGESPEEWMNRIHRDDVDQFCDDVDAHLSARTVTFQSEYRIRRKSGEILRMVARGVALRHDDGTPYRMAGSQSDITDRKQAEERLIHDALHDALTGLPNRTLLLDRLGQALARIKRNPESRFALAVLNLDRFRMVNESLGHGAGDDLLLAVSRRLENQIDMGDTLARLGADDFAVLMEDTPNEKTARTNVARIKKTIAHPFRLSGREVFTSASVGIVMGEAEYPTPTDLLRDAELAMARAKRDGKGKTETFYSSLRREAVGLMEAETDLRKAIEQERVVPYYQPIIALNTGRVVGFEALARIEHPQRGIVPPAEFIHIAEDTGLIVPMCEQMMSLACAQTAAWQEAFDLEGKLSVSVNLSARNLADENLYGMLEQVLADSGLSPGSLHVEITESLLMSNPELMEQTLQRLKTLDLCLALDDFGTGYSSLSYLQSFPLDVLKIDRSFVARMVSEARDQELVRIIVMLAHTLGLDVVAEGVETAGHADVLRALNCEFAQGFHYAAPMRAEEAGDILSAGFDV